VIDKNTSLEQRLETLEFAHSKLLRNYRLLVAFHLPKARAMLDELDATPEQWDAMYKRIAEIRAEHDTERLLKGLLPLTEQPA